MKDTHMQQRSCGIQRLRFVVLGAALVLLALLLIGCNSSKVNLTYTMNKSKDGYIVSYKGKYPSENLVIPAEHNGLPVVEVMSYSFDESPNLKSVTFEGISSMNVGTYAFQNCPALKSVVFKGKNISDLNIGKNAFSGCTALKSVTFGEDQIEELVLNKSAFAKCSDLEELSFAGGENTTITIPENAFPSELSLDRLSFKAGTVNWNYTINVVYSIIVAEVDLGETVLNTAPISAKNLTVSGGSLSLQNIESIEIGQGTTHEYISKPIIPKATFEEGFTFENGKYLHYYTKGIFNITYHYLPYASEIYLPVSVTAIPACFFGDEGECTVFYGGTAEQWSRVTVETEGNANFSEGRVNVKTSENMKYTVQFKGTDGAVLTDAVSVDYGSTITAPSVTAPAGSALTGWYRDAELTEKWLFDVHQVTENITLYAGFASTEDLEKTEVLTHKGFERLDNVFNMQVSYETTEIVLDSAFTVSPHATWIISLDEAGNQQIVGKITLQPGSNIYYLRVTSQNGAKTATYTLQIIREKLYTVIYQPQNGEANVELHLKKGAKLENKQFSKIGYRLNGWYLNGEKIDFETFTVSSDCTLVADWRPLQYTISFASDTGVAAVSVEYGALRSLPVPASEDQYAFGGWTDGSGNPFTDAAGKLLAPYSLLHDVTLYPIWNAIDYTITYKGADGLSNKNPATYNASSPTILLKSVSRPGYEFTGWYNGETQITVIPTGSKGNLILEAKWKPITYTVTYLDTRGASLEGLPVSFTVESDTLMLSDIAVPHYTFKGWYNASGQRVKTIAAGSNGNLVLYAKFNPNTYSVIYKNVFDGYNTNQAYYTVDDSDVILKDMLRPWYSFKGWYSDEACTQQVTVIDTAEGKDITLYADWDPATYEANYYVDGKLLTTLYFTYENRYFTDPAVPPKEGYAGKWSAYTVAPETLNINVIYTPVSYSITYIGTEDNGNPKEYNCETPTFTLNDAVKHGYRFLGWYNEKDEKVTEIAKGSTGDLTLTARFELARYSVTYENVHGVDTSKFPSSFTIESAPVTLPTVINVDGYTFNGWLLDGKRVTVIPKGTVGDITLTANLTPSVYTIILEPVGGTLSKNTFTVPMGGMLDLPVPKQPGKVFLGWFDNTGANALQYTDEKGDAIIPYEERAGRVLYAHWATVICNVTFETNGGESVATKQFSYGTSFDTEIVTQKDNSVFDGWYTADGSIEYTSSTMIVGDVTLYARWIDSTPISTAAEFLAIAQNPAGNYYLTNDINLKGNFWTPIESFTGKLDGRGYTVKNFIVSTTSLGGNFGMIYENSGVIENLNFADYTFNVTATCSGHAIVGLIGTNKGTISNCTLESGILKVTATIHNTGLMLKVGGLVGTNYGVITECNTFVDISANLKGIRESYGDSAPQFFFGGLVGYNEGSVTYSSAKLSINTTTYAGVAGSSWYNYCHNHTRIGGLIGCNDGNNDISSAYGQCYACYTDVSITHSGSNDGRGYDYSYIGGLVGQNIENGRIDSSYSNGAINGGTNQSSYLGGLVGYNESLAMIVSCYSTVDITTDRPGDVGGLVGYNAANVQNCYATGDVLSTVNVDIGALVGENASAGTVFKCYSSGDVTAPGVNCGFFVGQTAGILNKCFYLRGTSLLVNGVYYTHIVEFETVKGLTHNELWSHEFLVDQLYWDEEGWVILINEDPILNWELAIEHNYEITVVEPNCEEYGYSVYVCTDCPRFFVRDFVQPYGHARSEVRVFDPTCTGEGYTMYTCHRCDEVQTVDHQEPLGHEWKHMAHVDESCTVDGYELYECSSCNEEKKEIIPAGHKPITSFKGEPAVCIKHVNENGTVTFETTNGYTEEIVCSVCKKVLKASETVLPHSFDITSTTPPTCIKAGFGTYTCKHCGYTKNDVVPAIGHVDVNEDVRCDTCGELCGTFDFENAIHITTVEQLTAISKNLNGTYILDADLNMYGIKWTPIGTEQAPFTGYFYGNGHTIIALSVTDSEIGGIFGYNRGIINGLTVHGMSVNVTNINSVVGGIVAHNKGTVINCTLTGTVDITATATLTINSVTHSRLSCEAIFGGIVGENADIGTVKNCVSTANFENEYYATSVVETKGTVLTYLTRDHKKTSATVVSNVVFGGLVGRNNGMITECNISGKINNNIKTVNAEVIGGKGFWNHNIGYATTTLNFYDGIMVGINAGTIQNYNCTAEILTLPPEWEQKDSNIIIEFLNKFNELSFGHSAEFYYYSDYTTGRIVGMNYPYGIVTE